MRSAASSTHRARSQPVVTVRHNRGTAVRPTQRQLQLRPRSDPGLWTTILLALGIAVVTIAVYAPVRTFALVNWDDPTYIIDNPMVLGGLTWQGARWAFTTTHSPYWHPLTWLSLLADVSIFHQNAGGYHVTNLLIHVCTSVLVFLLLRRMTGMVGPSAFVAAIFAVHPLHVESVAWVAERKDVLSTLLWTLTIWTYVSYTIRRGLGGYAGMLVLYGLALMSKPMVVTLPSVLLLLDWWPLGRFREVSTSRLVLEKVPLLAMAATVSVVTIIVQRRVGAVAGLDALPMDARIANATVSYLVYIWKTIWPAGLAAFYPFRAYPRWEVAAAAMALVAATVTAVAVRTRAPYVLVGWLWYVVTLAPVIGLTQTGEQARADRFMYVPMIGLLLVVGWTARSWLIAHPTAPRRVAVFACALVLVSAVAARAQVNTWSDSVTLWQHAIAVVPGNYVAYQNLGEALRDRGRLDEALTSARQAFAYMPPNSPGLVAMLHNDVGLVLARQGNTADAAKDFAAAVRLTPHFAEAHINLGDALAAEGRLAEAAAHFQLAAELKPDAIEAQVGLGGTLLKEGRPADAVPHYQAALAQNPQLAEAHDGLGAALAMLGNDQRAMAEYDIALRLRPDLPAVHLNIAVMLIRLGRIEEARRQLLAALSIDPRFEQARRLLATIR